MERLTQKTDKYDLPPEKQELIVLASALHDIGKIAIDDKILNKPGRLTQEEFNIMKTHTVIGANMLDKLGIYRSEALVRTAYEICRWHHERWDGRGYPDGLSGDRIPISAQVVSMADVYDALVSKRVYKARLRPRHRCTDDFARRLRHVQSLAAGMSGGDTGRAERGCYRGRIMPAAARGQATLQHDRGGVLLRPLQTHAAYFPISYRFITLQRNYVENCLVL